MRAKELKARAVRAIDVIIAESPTWKFTDFNYSGQEFKKRIRRKRKISWLENVVEYLERTIKQGGEHMCRTTAGNGIERYFIAYKWWINKSELRKERSKQKLLTI